jgi:hypothetical protein
MKNTYVSFFENYRARFSDKKISVWNWLMEDLGLSDQVQGIRKSNDKDYVRQAKSSLPAVTMSGLFGERNSKKIISHSGFICIDIDGKDNPKIDDFETLKKILSDSKYIQYAGLSISGNGLFCLIKISNPDKHREHFNSLLDYFFKMGITIDKACSDVTRLRIYSIDDKPYVNEYAEVYSDTVEVSNYHAISNEYVTNEKTPNFNQRELKENIITGSHISIVQYSRETKVFRILKQIESEQIDITSDYNDWISLCIAIAFRYKEEGREMFHEICRYYPGYSFEECDYKYSAILKGGYRKSITALYEIAEKYGIGL